MRIERILCSTDLSPESDSALRYAIALARTYEAKLFILHCAETTRPIDDSVRDRFNKQVEASVRQWTGTCHYPPANYEGILISGMADEAITKTAAEHRIDLIVMSSRHRRMAAAMLGSTAEAVCRTAPSPVLITYPSEREWVGLTYCEIDLRRILVAQDFSNDSELALRMAISLAQEYQAELHLMHVLPVTLASVTDELPLGIESGFQRTARLLQQSVPEEVYLWCKVIQTVDTGQPYRKILTYAEEKEIDLICMGVHGAGFSMRALFGSNTDRVLRQAPCPVLIARPLKPVSSK